MGNRRQSRFKQALEESLARMWQIRFVLFLALSYLFLFGWLFSGPGRPELPIAEALATPADPLWEKPDRDLWFGATGTGVDLFQLSRRALANSVAVAVVVSSLGVSLAFLLVMLFAMDPGEKRFFLLKSGGRTITLIPAVLVTFIVADAGNGSLVAIATVVTLVIALQLGPILAAWFEDAEKGPEIVAAYSLGLTRGEIVVNRVLPVMLRRSVGVFAQLIPAIVLLEMGLAFLGFSGQKLSVGSIVRRGQEVIIEAPWMAIYPGVMATVVVFMLFLLAALVSRALRTGEIPRHF